VILVDLTGEASKMWRETENTVATEVSLPGLRAIAVDSHGDLLLGDGKQVKRIERLTGRISVVAEDGQPVETVEGLPSLYVPVDGSTAAWQGHRCSPISSR
jgi:hypothetical protein